MTDYKLYSFDIFDTLVTRTVAKPDGIFVLMQNAINRNPDFADLPSDVKENFYNYRKNASFYQRQLKKTLNDYSEISLDLIYEHIKNTFYLTLEQTEKLKQLEIETELKNTLGIKSNIEKLKQLYNSGKRVILISDMYLPKEVVEQILVNIDPVFKDIKLYLSSDIGFMKAQGEMYKYVKEQENVDYKEWCHTGDNKVIDIKIAKQLGIQTKLYKYVGFKNYEKQLLDKRYFSPYVQLAIGTSRNLRLNLFENSIKAQFGASLTANILYPYVAWLLEQAKNRDIKHLFFIARDAYIPQKMADEIIKIKGLDITTSYLYGSRKVWKNSGITENNKELLITFIKQNMSTNIQQMAVMCELSEKELRGLLPDKYKNFKRKLNSHNKQELLNYLQNSEEFINLIINKGKSKKQKIYNYMKQELNKYKKPSAFADIDGSGITNVCLGKAIKDLVDHELNTFYLTSTPTCCKPDEMHLNYFYALKRGGLGYILESLVRTPHGQTKDYAEKDGVWSPILEDIDKKIFENWKYEEYLDGILKFTKEFTQCLVINHYVTPESQAVMDGYIKFITTSVDKETACLMQGITRRFQSNVINDEFAPKLNILDCIKYLLTGHTKSENIMYSSMRSSLIVRMLINLRFKRHKR